MACPICGANCRCRNRGPHGECCGCHRHKAQRGFTRRRLNHWRTSHALAPIGDDEWEKKYAQGVQPDLIDTMEEGDDGQREQSDRTGEPGR